MRRLLLGLVSVGVLSAVGGGCGGESIASDDDGAGEGGSAAGANGGQGGGVGARGGTATGGTSSGATGFGGSSVAGTSSGASGTTSGTSGEAGAANAGCWQMANAGPCEGAFERWYFDAASGVCRRFIYGGCEPNGNNFLSIDACYAECAEAGGIDVTACTTANDCLVTAARCCGCAGADFSTVTAVNRSSVGAFQSAMHCDLVDCAGCELGPEFALFGATCRSGRCIAFDAQQTELTTCTSSTDCRLRQGLGCCESCTTGFESLISVNESAGLSELVCGEGPIGCPLCPVSYPTNASAECSLGRCSISVTQDQ